jgi:hypothetical protein
MFKFSLTVPAGERSTQWPFGTIWTFSTFQTAEWWRLSGEYTICHGSGANAGTGGRTLCTKLYLKAETQQVDRILVEFSRRWQECNPGNLFGSASK